MVKVLFVCMGNICRSPTAEGVFRHLVNQQGLDDVIEIDSAGTIAYHVGNAPDLRATQTAKLRDIDISDQRSRVVKLADFENFDYIIAMDYENENNLNKLCPDEHKEKIHMFLKFATGTDVEEVPDPYYGSGNGFEIVLNLVENASDGLLRHLKQNELSR